VLDGVDGVDSFVVNPHAVVHALRLLGALPKRATCSNARSRSCRSFVTREQEEVVNYMDYGVQLGRRFRALKLWMVIRAFGVEGLTRPARALRACAQARGMGWREPDGKSSRRSTSLSARLRQRRQREGAGRDQRGDRQAVNASGEAYLFCWLNGRLVLRFAIGNIRTTEDHVRGVEPEPKLEGRTRG
jgi:aromatic-L-amino-acid decarboxylase